jgi:hypothetical protein
MKPTVSTKPPAVIEADLKQNGGFAAAREPR